MKKKFFILIIFLNILLLLTPTVLCDDIDYETIDVDAEITSYSINSENKIQIPETNSRACVVIDRNTNTVLYGKNENTQRKMASTTKIMTAIVIIENYNLDETIEISKKAAGTGGSRLGLKTGDKITIKDLLYGLMLCSGNDAAVALAEYACGDIQEFSKLMNNKANSLGLTNTHFETPHGLDSDEHYTTAYELALLSNYALTNKTFSQIVGTKNYTVTINGYSKNLSNTNELLGNLEGVYGIKTGFTNGANRCLVTACKRNDMDIICVVLGADTKKFRTQDSIKLINYIFDNFELVNIKELLENEFNNWKNENLNNFVINKGTSQNIQLTLDDSDISYIPIRKDLIKSIYIDINCEKYFEAPLNENIEIGIANVFCGETDIINSKIYTTSKINKKTAYSYFLYFIKNFNIILEKGKRDVP